ncbi:MAG: hypothetical protein ACLP7W_02760 [Solirubrobacteraceae bacterium]
MSLDTRHETQDLVRVRSRMLKLAYESGATHLLFADADNAWEPETVIGMLRTGKDFVQCPYLRRDGRGYTIRPTAKDRKAGRTAPEDIQEDNTIEIEGTGFGLTLISRECIGKMLEHYSKVDTERRNYEGAVKGLESGNLSKGEAIAYLRDAILEIGRWRAGHMGLNVMDRIGDVPYPMTALFQLVSRDGVLFSEDTSFAQRWRDIGGKVWLYIGEGSPIAHYGTHKWQGSIEDLGFTRGKAAAE